MFGMRLSEDLSSDIIYGCAGPCQKPYGPRFPIDRDTTHRTGFSIREGHLESENVPDRTAKKLFGRSVFRDVGRFFRWLAGFVEDSSEVADVYGMRSFLGLRWI